MRQKFRPYYFTYCGVHVVRESCFSLPPIGLRYIAQDAHLIISARQSVAPSGLHEGLHLPSGARAYCAANMKLSSLAFGPAAAYLALLLHPLLVDATFWTVTSYYEVVTTVSQFSTFTYSFDYLTYTNTLTVKPGVTPTASAVSVSTAVDTFEQLTIVYIYVAAGSVPEDDIITTTPSYSTVDIETIYVEPVVYTAPSSCPTPFTFSTYSQVILPTEVTSLVTPTSLTTTVIDFDSFLTEVTAYLAPTEVPPLTQVTTDFLYTYYIAKCQNPTSFGAAPTAVSGGSGGSGGGTGSPNVGVCAGLNGCTSLETWVIVIAALLPSLFLLGWVESFLWFRRLMLGKTALRFGTICWTLISLWVLCFTRVSPARSAEDQKALQAQWKSMSAGTVWKLWWKWGFRHAYPVAILGADPRIQGPVPGMQQMQQPPREQQLQQSQYYYEVPAHLIHEMPTQKGP